jgi:hypothetical protein
MIYSVLIIGVASFLLGYNIGYHADKSDPFELGGKYYRDLDFGYSDVTETELPDEIETKSSETETIVLNGKTYKLVEDE